jgi:hypothetical protein
MIYISKPEFRKHLAENQVSTREFLYQMKLAGIEVVEKRKKMGSGWKDATGTINIETYVINTTKLSNKSLGATSELT